MKKQLFITALSGLLFTGAMYGEETTSAALEKGAPVTNEQSSLPLGEKTPPASTEQKTSYMTRVANVGVQAKAWCANHKLLLGGTAAVVGVVVLWKTCPAFRAFLGFEDEQEQDTKFAY